MKWIPCCLLFLFSFFTTLFPFPKPQWQHRLRYKIDWCSTPQWMKDQIHADLNSIDPKAFAPQFLSKQLALTPQCLRCKIDRSRTVFQHPADLIDHPRSDILERCFTELASIVKLPPIEFIVSIGDKFDDYAPIAPVFSFAKNGQLQEQVILFPDFEALDGHIEPMKSVNRGLKYYPWKSRSPKSIWRGAMTGIGLFDSNTFLTAQRSHLISMSLKHPDLIDAKFSSITQCLDPDIIISKFPQYFSESLKITEHLKYKYQILADGNSCAYARAYWQLFSNSVIFKHNSPNVQWYYRALKPFVHYIPVESNFNDLATKIQWAIDHDDQAEKIARSARTFALKNLQKSDIYLYLYRLLCAYAEKQKLAS